MSAISLGDDKTWSDNDDESLFSSAKDAKPSLVKPQQQGTTPAIPQLITGQGERHVTNDMSDTEDTWDDESLPLSSRQNSKTKVAETQESSANITMVTNGQSKTSQVNKCNTQSHCVSNWDVVLCSHQNKLKLNRCVFWYSEINIHR